MGYYVNETKEREKAEETYQQMKIEFPNERLTKEALSMLGKTLSVHKEKGEYKVTFNASKLASGVYIYRIIAGDFVRTKKMNLVK